MQGINNSQINNQSGTFRQPARLNNELFSIERMALGQGPMPAAYNYFLDMVPLQSTLQSIVSPESSPQSRFYIIPL